MNINNASAATASSLNINKSSVQIDQIENTINFPTYSGLSIAESALDNQFIDNTSLKVNNYCEPY